MNSSTYVYNTNKKSRKILQILFSLLFSLFIIFIAVKSALLFKSLYYFDIKYLSIDTKSNFSRDEIIKNYDYIINYLLSPKEQEFVLPSIPYSKYGQIHFRDVKKIFTSIDILLISTGIISFIGVYLNLKHNKINFLKRTSSLLIILPALLLTAIMIDFDNAFTIFHKIFFRNDYWQFDPILDPIINILPEEFFYHCALLIVLIIILSSIILRLIHMKLCKRLKLFN